jgi:hypothetical protein
MTLRQDARQIASGADTLYRQRVETYPGASVGTDAGGRARVSQLTTLFDGKTLGAENALLWDTQGTGTATYSEGANTLTVAAGQYLVRQSRQYLPYFSGKPQVAEITFDGFANQTGVVKRFGYFSSSAVAPYTAGYDGWYVEADGSTYRLVVVRGGVKMLDLPWTQWDAYSEISTYDWNNFTVTLTDFLWLGGAVLRFFIKNPAGGFTLAHTFDYAGSGQGTFMLSPNQPVRYEVRSTSGAGAMRTICSQVATEGSISENGQSLGVYNTALLAANTVGTTYALLGVKKQAAYRDAPVRIDTIGAGTTTSDAGVLLLLRNPTLSAPLVYGNTGRIQAAVATGQTVVADGRVAHAAPIVASGVSSPLVNNSLSWLSSGIANNLDEWVLAYRVLTLNQTLVGTLNLVEY